MESSETYHRRCRSDAVGLLEQELPLLMPQAVKQEPGHMRSVSLGSSASQFLQSLKLQDPSAFQHSLQQGVADQEAMPDQHIPAHALGDAHADMASPAGKASMPGVAAAQDCSTSKPARGKRPHRSSNGRTSKAGVQADSAEGPGFTPLPAVVEDGLLDSERDWDSDSDREGVGPNRRGSRGGNRRGGYNGRSESELMLLDPKRVKRILANRESAARSKERRMNYTMELEGKLQVLGLESDKLRGQLNSLSKQDVKLAATKADLQHQVQHMQQQLSAVVSDNQALMSTLFQLQAAMGLPQVLPDSVVPNNIQACMADGSSYQQSWHLYQQQECDGDAQPTSPKPRKPRQRQTKQQQHSKQHKSKQPTAGTSNAWGSTYAGCEDTDLNDPAAAAAAPVAELPVRTPSFTHAGSAAAAAAAPRHTSSTPTAAAAPSAAVLGPAVMDAAVPGVAASGRLHAAQPAATAAAAGGSAMPVAQQVQPRQHQWHTGLGRNSSSTAQRSSSTSGMQLPAAVLLRPSPGGGAGTAAAACTPAGGGQSAGAAAGAAPGLLQLQPQVAPTCADDALMGDADEEERAMLGALLGTDAGSTPTGVEVAAQTATQPDTMVAAAAAAATAAGTAGGVSHGGQGGQGGGPYGPASAGASILNAAEAAGAGRPGALGSTTALPAGWAAGRVGSSALMNSPPAAAAQGGYIYRHSPALSDPVAGEYWPDDISSGSLGGSHAHSITPNLTPNARQAEGGVNGVSPAHLGAAACQQQQPGSQQGACAAGAAGGGRSLGFAQAPAAGAAALSGVWGSGPPSGSGSMTSPLTPMSGRMPTPAETAAGVARMTGCVTPPANHTAAAAAADAQSGQPYAPYAAGYAAVTMSQQQQQQVGPALVSPSVQTSGGSFPAALGPAAARDWGTTRHMRSASTGCVSGLTWQGFEPYAPLPPALQQMQAMQPPAPQQLQTPAVSQGPLEHTAVANAEGSAAAFAAAVHRGTSSVAPAVTGAAVFSTIETSCEVVSTGDAGQSGMSGQRHRRSHSHAAAFMAQGGITVFDASMTQQQQQQFLYGAAQPGS